MTKQSQITSTLQVGDKVFVPIHDFIKESCDYLNGDEFMHSFYGSTGVVVDTHMTEERLPAYARVYFESIGGDQMLRRSDMVNHDDGTWSIIKR